MNSHIKYESVRELYSQALVSKDVEAYSDFTAHCT